MSRPVNAQPLRVLFVGAFAPAGPDGTVGGITFACRSLLASPLSAGIDFRLIDSTASTNQPRNLVERGLPALRRLGSFLRQSLFGGIDRVVIFSAHGGSFYEKGVMAIIARARGLPVVFAPRSGFLQGELENNAVQARFARWVFACCNSVVCQSDMWRQFYARFCPSEKLAVVPNWIDTERYPAVASSARYAVPTVLFMAWVVREKGIHELIDALITLQNRVRVPFDVVICGDGGELPAVRERARAAGLDRVEFRGWTGGAEKAELFRRCHAFVLPSWYEGLSNSLLEAMASGLAVISTDVGAAVDLVRDGENGFLVPSRASEPLADRLGQLLESPELRERLGAAAHADIVAGHAIQTGVARLLALIRDDRSARP